METNIETKQPFFKRLGSGIKRLFTTKKGLIATGVIVLAGALAWFGISSIERPTTFQMAMNNIAEARFFMKCCHGESTVGRVQLYSGLREENYAVDGIANPTRPFTVISIQPTDNRIIVGGNITIDVVINSGEPETVTLERNPYGTNFAADLGRALAHDSVVQITFRAGTETIATVTMKCIMPEDAISWQRALEIASNEMSSQIASAGRFEAFVKILCDSTTVNKPFWFVSFATESGESFFVVVDPEGRVVGTSEQRQS